MLDSWMRFPAFTDIVLPKLHKFDIFLVCKNSNDIITASTLIITTWYQQITIIISTSINQSTFNQQSKHVVLVYPQSSL